MPRTAFYTVSDARFFPGLLGLLNSLRLIGHDEPLYVVDAGLTGEQREVLRDHVTLLPAPAGDAAVLLAPVGPLQCPADVAVIIDADIIVTRPLHDVIEAARAGRIVGFINCPPVDHRTFPEWGEALGLGEIRPQPYLNAGLLALSEPMQKRLLQPFVDAQHAVGLDATRYGKAYLDDAFYFADQDILNALLSASFAPDELAFLDYRLAPHPPFTGLRLADESRLLCRYDDGVAPYLLHHTMPKPWLQPTRTTVYSRLLSRLLLADDAPIHMAPEELPMRLRQGRQADAARIWATAAVLARTTLRRQLGRFGIRTRLRDVRARRNAARQPH